MNCENCQQDTGPAVYFHANDFGGISGYCESCYSKIVLDNYEEPVPDCECGTTNPVGDGHYGYCPRYRRQLA
jgi:hypothetical protein